MNNFAITATALDPAILLTWNANLNAVLVNYLEGNDMTGLLIQGSSEGFLTGAPARERFAAGEGYNHFKIFIDSVSTKFHIGNLADEFEIITDKDNYYSTEVVNIINNIPSRDDANTYQANLDILLCQGRKVKVIVQILNTTQMT